MNDNEVLKWILFGLIITHFILSSYMWIKNDSIKQDSNKLNSILRNNNKIFFLSVIIFSVSLLFISLIIFDKENDDE